MDATLDERGEALTPLANRTSCFARTSRWEVAVHGKKIVGSAQRRLGGAILQHGSILNAPFSFAHRRASRVREDTERSLLRARLASKATCVGDEIGQGDHVQRLRSALEGTFAAGYPQLC